jgi:hypothetical protein
MVFHPAIAAHATWSPWTTTNADGGAVIAPPDIASLSPAAADGGPCGSERRLASKLFRWARGRCLFIFKQKKIIKPRH